MTICNGIVYQLLFGIRCKTSAVEGKAKMKTMTKTTYASKLSEEKEVADDLEIDEYIKNLPKIGTRTENGKFLYPNSTDPWE